MRWTSALPTVGVLLLAACANLSGARALSGVTSPGAAQAQAVALDQPFTLKVGGVTNVGTERVRVAFERVASDSRCPKDVQCIQAGEAHVRALLTLAGRRPEPLELTTTPKGESGEVGGFVLRLTRLEPVPLAAKPTRSADYRATFVLTRR